MKQDWAHNSSFTPFPAWVCFSCTLTCLKTKLKGLTSYLQLFEIDVYKGQFLIEFLMAVCLSLIILFSHPSANFKRNVRKKQRLLDYEMPAGFLKTDILSVQDMKQETSLTPVKEHCRKKKNHLNRVQSWVAHTLLETKKKKKNNPATKRISVIYFVSLFKQVFSTVNNAVFTHLTETAAYLYCTEMKK